MSLKDSYILTGQPVRHATKPIKYKQLYDLRKKQEAVLWPAEEVSLKEDILRWNLGLFKNPQQDANAKRLLKFIFIFFNYGDGLVGSNLSKNLSKITIREALDFYATQAHIEAVHNESYSRINEALIPDETESLVNILKVHPAIAAKIKWTQKWIDDPNATIQQNVVAFSIVESIFFSASFLIIYWVKKYGLLHGVCDYNDQIARDENIHKDFACAVYKLVELECRLSRALIINMIDDAVNIESEFIAKALDDQELEGLKLDDVKTYIRYIADLLLIDLGYEVHYKCINPFPWIAMIQLEPKKNMFEKKTTEYQKANTAKAESNDYDFSDEVSF